MLSDLGGPAKTLRGLIHTSDTTGETERPHWTTPANPTDTSQSESHPSGMQPQRQSHRDQQTPPQLGQQVPIASRPRSPSPASHGFASSDGVRGEKLDDAFRVANQTSSARGMMDALMIGGEAETVLEREGGGAMLHSVVVLAQLERAASRLKTGHTFLAPCAVDARPTTMRQLYALIVRYSPAEPASHADGTRWGMSLPRCCMLPLFHETSLCHASMMVGFDPMKYVPQDGTF